jgi:hypothetical protein
VRPDKHSDAQKRKAVSVARALLDDGKSLTFAATTAAKQAGVTKTTILRWADALGEPLLHSGMDAEQSTTKNARAAKAVYDQKRRLDMSDELFQLVRGKAKEAKPSELPPLVTAFAILTDKRRLEEGAATDRHDWGNQPEPSVERSKALRLQLLRKSTG